MRRINIVYTSVCVALLAFALQGCRTENLDNVNIITKPYALFFADSMGYLYSTNDGQNVEVVASVGGGIPISTIETSDKYIFVRFANSTVMHISDGGQGNVTNFNPTYTEVHPSSFGQSCILNAVKFGKTDRVYIASDKGVIYNDSNGVNGSQWFQDADASVTLTSITSYARLANGKVVAFDNGSRKLMVKENADAKWVSPASAGLPPAGSGQLAIISKGNEIIAYAYGNDAAANGFWRSTDEGASFVALPPIPENPFITDATGAFGRVLIATTFDKGIWRLSGQGKWEPALGLDNKTKVLAISAQNNLYKNKSNKEFIFAATSTGAYRSDDLGQNWIKIYEPVKGASAIR